MYRLRNKQKYFTLHYCGKVKAEAASPGHKKSVKSVGHKKTPTDFTDSLSLTQVLHKRKFFLSYLVAKKMQTSAKKACFQFVECSFSSAKIRLFLVTSKVLGKNTWKGGGEKENRRLPELRAAYWMLFLIPFVESLFDFFNGRKATAKIFRQSLT